jgi:hypothetical protein
VTRTTKVRGIGTALTAVVGGALGTGAAIGLSHAVHQDSYATNGLEYLSLPLVGAVAAVALLKHDEVATSTERSVDVATSFERHDRDVSGPDGQLSAGGAPVATLVGGQGTLPLELAMMAYRQPLELNGRTVEWSTRSWIPGLNPACERAARVKSVERLPTNALAGVDNDAAVCAKDGWAFADELSWKVAAECKRRLGGSCRSCR